ncbi:MAG: radical SAM protein [Nitrospirota bacterium]
MTKCLLIAPEFFAYSFWSVRETAEIMGARHTCPPLGLITIAALLPREWEVRLLDLNVQEMEDSLVDWADIVMTGGMITQQRNILSLIELCRRHGKRVAVGGQDPTSQPEVYAAADYLILDEGEATVPAFLDDFRRGAAQGIYRAEETPDMTTSPAPRFDLLDLTKYIFVGIQTSRGCPFNCEFCDIIELYGRKPRTKTPEQLLKEFEFLYRLGYRGHVDFADDNFIGNKKNVTALLPRLLAWSRERGYPFYFSTQASLNLADDPNLLNLMEALDFRYVFLGIETPDKDLLLSTRKKENTRHPIVESVRKIYEHGIVVMAGFIVGFDGETRKAAASIATCAEAAGIPMVLLGLLTALPNTQLARRLAREGRLHENYSKLTGEHFEQSASGLNFVPLRPREEVLEDYALVLRRLYSPEGYFQRVLLAARLLKRRAKQRGRMRGRPREIVVLVSLVRKLGFTRGTAWAFWKTFVRILAARPRNAKAALHIMALYLHYAKHADFIQKEIERQIAEIGESRSGPSNADTPRRFENAEMPPLLLAAGDTEPAYTLKPH